MMRNNLRAQEMTGSFIICIIVPCTLIFGRTSVWWGFYTPCHLWHAAAISKKICRRLDLKPGPPVPLSAAPLSVQSHHMTAIPKILKNSKKILAGVLVH